MRCEGINPLRLKRFVRPLSVITPFRAVVANRLATAGPEWAEVFARENSGTQNDQWMVVDMKVFRGNGKRLMSSGGSAGTGSVVSGVLTVLEQMPGVIVWDDQTAALAREGYWASYNNPYLLGTCVFWFVEFFEGVRFAR